jgi:hypothetical protein
VTGPALEDSSRVEGPGARVVEAVSSWRFMVFVALIQSSLSSYKSETGSMLITQPDADSQRRLLFDDLFHP